MIRRVANGCAHRIDDVIGRRGVWIADPKRDDIDPLIDECGFLGIDLREQIRSKMIEAFGGLHTFFFLGRVSDISEAGELVHIYVRARIL